MRICLLAIQSLIFSHAHCQAQAFLALVFGVDFHESGDGDGGEATTTKRKKKKKAKGPAFPNLRAMGLIEMKGCVVA